MEATVSASVPSYQPEVIERHATRLVARARRFHRGAMVTGALLGGAAGAVPLLRLDLCPFPARFALAPVLIGLLVGGLIGHAVGKGRAELLRLHAQMVLCQLHAQRATLAIWKVVREQPVVHAAPSPAPVLVPEPPEPVVEPELEPAAVEVPNVPPLTAPLLRLPSQTRATG